jgi:hypothetical protein
LYKVASADVGFTIRVRVTAFNADGNASAASNPTAVVVAAASKPANTVEPKISGTPAQGQTLTATTGTWTNNPTSFAYQWLRCPQSGGNADGSGCTVISGAAANTYLLAAADRGFRIRVRVTATNAGGSTSAVSNPTAIVTTAAPPPPATGCPSGSGPIAADDVKAPARLLIDRKQASPSVLSRGTPELTLRFHVTACGRPVVGALVYVAAVPFNQFTTAERTTDGSGWAQLDLRVLSAYPVSGRQTLLALFARARKSGDPLLAGVSSRRLFAVRVRL